jgi:putative transport protein
MEAIVLLLNSQPFITLFLVIGIGYAVGRISIGGFSLGIGAVLFVGLAFGAFAPEAAPPALLGLIGLIMFLYGIGIQYGKHFFAGLASSFGIKANLLSAAAVITGCAVALVLGRFMGFSSDFGAGMFAGSMTSTASLQAAIDAASSQDPAVGYAISYPFGVFGPMLFFYLTFQMFKPKVAAPSPKRLVTGELRAGDRGLVGKTVAQLLEKAPEGLKLLLIKRDGVNMLPEGDLVLQNDDLLSIAGFPETIGEINLDSSENVRSDRRHLDYVRVFVSKEKFVGKKLSEL